MDAAIETRGWSSRRAGSSLAAMPGTVALVPPTDEAALAARAGAGDGAAFAELYERYEKRAFNLCYRITGSYEDAADATQEAFLGVLRRLPQLGDREFSFGSYLFTAARNACYDLIARRRRAEPSELVSESAAPVGAGPGGGAPPDPRDPSEDPDRNVLLAAQQEEIRQANESLPERQREVLALRELEELSYDEIAEIMGMNRNSVAQLISRARINLRDALRGTALHSFGASSGECERGLALLAMRQDGQLAAEAEDAGWLRGHLVGCGTCRLSDEAMQEAGVSYRAWVPIGVSPLLFKETMARAAELVGADWSEAIEVRRAPATSGPGGWWRFWRFSRSGHRRRDLAIAAVLAAIMLVAVFEAELHDDPAPPATVLPVAEQTPAPDPAAKPTKRRKDKEPADQAPPTSVQEPVTVDAGPAGGSKESKPRTRRRPRKQAVAQDEEPIPPVVEEVAPTTTPEPEPPPATTEPPTSTPPTEDPPQPPPRVCRDANGRTIPCPP
jgi:RNA polymerase sigma factor (sigma-70 family)